MILGAGFGRTGTTSLKRALEILGCGPCYHMQTAMTRPGHCRFWLRAQQGGPVDFGRFLRGYTSAIDWPVCEFLPPLLETWPQARVILTVRDADRWYDSVRETLWEIDRHLPWWFPPSIRRMHNAVIWNGRFGGRFLERAHAVEVFRTHEDEVRRSVPARQLLVFDVAQGWEPLCAFLGRPVPDEPFPRLNDREFFLRLLATLRIGAWAVPAALAAGVLGLAMRYGA
jgi:hypothetical protein